MLHGRSLLTLLDYTPEEIEYLLDLADTLKAQRRAGVTHRLCDGKNIALIFEKTSTRTRCAFEVAARELGIGVTYLDPLCSQIGKKESIRDTARVLGRLYDGIEYRGFAQSAIETLAEYAGVPVWNGLTDEFHPTQALADLMTVRERLGRLRGVKLVYMGDARFNMGCSLMVACAKTGMHFVACAPEKYFPPLPLVEKCRRIAADTGAALDLITEPDRAVRDADIIYTDVWVSMGEPEAVWAERIPELLPYQVNTELMRRAGEQALFMHCLPAFHDLDTEVGRRIGERFGLSALEVTDEVFESERSIVFDEAENRLHTTKALLAATL